MSPRDFCYWLQGYFELTPLPSLDNEQVAEIKRHLELVFNSGLKPAPEANPNLPEVGRILNDIWTHHHNECGLEVQFPEVPVSC